MATTGRSVPSDTRLPPRPVSVRPRGSAPGAADWPYPCACPPGRPVAPPGRPAHAIEDLRATLVAAREERSPEGLSVTRTAWFYSLLFAGVFAAVMIGAIVLTIARSFGWAAVAVGVLLLLAYIVVGGGPEWIAGRMRTRERRDIEEEVTLRLGDVERPGRDAPE